MQQSDNKLNLKRCPLMLICWWQGSIVLLYDILDYIIMLFMSQYDVIAVFLVLRFIFVFQILYLPNHLCFADLLHQMVST